MTKDEALKLAMDWFCCYLDKSMSRNNAETLAEETITAIKEALAQPEPNYKKAFEVWLDKTEWVQETVKPHELGMHRADVLKQRIKEVLAQPEQDSCYGYKGKCNRVMSDGNPCGLNAPCPDCGLSLIDCPKPQPWEKFCDSNCVWTDHHPDCKLAQPEQDGKCKYCTDGCPACDARKSPEQEPFMASYEFKQYGYYKDGKGTLKLGNIPATQPPQRTWVGLTDEEIQYCVELKNPEAIAEEVEAKLKEKNT